MKRISIFLSLMIVVAFASTSFAYPVAVTQFKDGAKEVITSPMTVKDSVIHETRDTRAHVYPLALTGGLLKGVFYMGKHIVDGSFAMATSPLKLMK